MKDLLPTAARGQAKILDFGLAKLTHPAGARHGVPLHAEGADGARATAGEEHLTSPSVAMGAIAYMFPE